MYTAIVINEDERNYLLRTCFRYIGFPEDGWILRAHHITINMGTFNRDIQIHHRERNGYLDYVPHALGQRCSGNITRILYKPDDGIIALGLISQMRQHIPDYSNESDYMHVLEAPIYSVNDVAHITIAHRADVKPKKANDYPQDQWVPLRRKTPIKIEGTLTEVETINMSHN